MKNVKFRIFPFILLLLFGVVFVPQNSAIAGYSSNYECDSYKSASVLKACVKLNGASSYFRVRKADGGTFQSSGVMKIRVGGWQTYAVEKGQTSYNAGVNSVDVDVDITYFTNTSKDFYATTQNSEYWVGPITVTHEATDTPPEFLTNGSVKPPSGSAGSTFTYEVLARDIDGDDISMSINITKPNGSQTGWTSVPYISGSSTNGATFRYNKAWSTSGTYQYYFKAVANSKTAHSQTQNGPTVESGDTPPEFLTNGSVKPPSGSAGSTFTYEVLARDIDGDDISMSINITKPNGSQTGWTSVPYISGSSTNGATFRYNKAWSTSGTYQYYFKAVANSKTAHSQTQNGPTVESGDTPPEFLTNGSVKPPSGSAGSTFTYEVLARDIDGDDISMSINITKPNGSQTGWTSVPYISGSSTNGATFRYNKAWSTSGTYQYYFKAVANSKTAHSQTQNGPTVESGGSPTIVNVSPSTLTVGPQRTIIDIYGYGFSNAIYTYPRVWIEGIALEGVTEQNNAPATFINSTHLRVTTTEVYDSPRSSRDIALRNSPDDNSKTFKAAALTVLTEYVSEGIYYEQQFAIGEEILLRLEHDNQIPLTITAYTSECADCNYFYYWKSSGGKLYKQSENIVKWTPPSNSSKTKIFLIKCTLGDGKGNIATRSLTTSNNIFTINTQILPALLLLLGE